MSRFVISNLKKVWEYRASSKTSNSCILIRDIGFDILSFWIFYSVFCTIFNFTLLTSNLGSETERTLYRTPGTSIWMKIKAKKKQAGHYRINATLGTLRFRAVVRQCQQRDWMGTLNISLLNKQNIYVEQ